MKLENILLTELDLKHIFNLIGREPTEIELGFIESVLSYELKNREYLEILARLDNGAGRTENNEIFINNEYIIRFINGLKIYNKRKLVHDKDNSIIDFQINGIDPIISSYSFFSDNIDKTIIKKLIGRKNKSDSQQVQAIQNEATNIVFSSIIGLESSKKLSLIDNIDNYLLYKFDFGKSIKKNVQKFESFVELANNEEWFTIIYSNNNHSIGGMLVDMLNNINCGAIISNILLLYNTNTKNNNISILVIFDKKNIKQIKSYCMDLEISIEELGYLTIEKAMQINDKNENTINLPLTAFDLRLDINTKHYKETNEEKFIFTDIIKGVEKTSFTNQLLKLFEKINKTNSLWTQKKKSLKIENERYGSISKNENLNEQMLIVQADNNNMLSISPRMSGKMSVANASRKMSCMGIKPNYVLIHDIFPESNSESNWAVSEILQGQEEAIRELDLDIGNRQIDAIDKYLFQNVLVIGNIKNNSPQTGISFKNDGDFISLLGSHRGELGGSGYEKYISDKSSKSFPSVDLNMERRLQDVIQQGIGTNLIKSATNVGIGGISVAVAKSLVASDIGIGARIHLSRKLTDQELLFGETQGLVVVTLSEVDIMEFERICMTVGVPSTTIGRVTEDNSYSFNKSINLKVDRLRKTLD